MEETTSGDTPRVTERNTKQEILAAYERLRAQAEGRLAALPFDTQRNALTEALQTFATLKSQLGAELDRLADGLPI